MSDRIAVMNAGTIRQVGPPREIYEHPAERFVADFIGDTNFLPAQVQGQQDGTVTVQLASGTTITARAIEGAAPTGEVTLAVRPEHGALTTADKGLLPGTLGEVVYIGTDTHFHVELDDGTGFVVRRQNGAEVAQDHRTGDRVGVSFAPGTGQVLRD